MPSIFQLRGLLLLLVLTILNAPAKAFVPTTGVKNDWGDCGRSHEDITRSAWAVLAQKYFGSSSLTSAMSAVLDTIVNANAATDDNQSNAELHFDGESFPEGQERLQNLVAGVIQALQQDDPSSLTSARNLVGTAFHTVQDFYAHSNWVEEFAGSQGINQVLGVAGQTMSRLGPNDHTCQDCDFHWTGCNDCSKNLDSAGVSSLTSGYYGGENRVIPNAYKCSHGGPFDPHEGIHRSPTFDGINKDLNTCIDSPHYNWHSSAADYATTATETFFDVNIAQHITQAQLAALFAAPSASASNSVLSSTLNNTTAVIKRSLGFDESSLIAGSGGRTYANHWIDNGHSVVQMRHFVTNKYKRANVSIDNLPELYSSVVNTTDNSPLFVFAGSNARITVVDLAHISSLAGFRNIKIYMILLGTLSEVDHNIYNITRRTGGQVFSLKESEAEVAGKIVKFLSRDNSVDILSVANTKDHKYSVPIDSTLTNVTFSISGSTSVNILRPNGTAIRASDRDIDYYPLSTGLFVHIQNPPVGQWNVCIAANSSSSTISGSQGSYSLSVGGTSPLDAVFNFVRQSGRPGHEGPRPINSLPGDGEPISAIAKYTGNATSASFDLRDKAGNVLDRQLNLTSGATDNKNGTPSALYYTNSTSSAFIPPDAWFLVYMTGRDTRGNYYQRVNPVEYTVTRIGITSPPSFDITTASTRNLTFLIQNKDTVGDQFFLSSWQSLSKITPIGNQTITDNGISTSFYLAANASKEFTVQVSVSKTEAGFTDVVTVNAYRESYTGNDHFSFSSTSLYVIPGTPTFDTYTWNGTLTDSGRGTRNGTSGNSTLYYY